MKRPNPKNTNPLYWNSILKDAGLGVRLRPLPKKRVGKKRRVRKAD